MSLIYRTIWQDNAIDDICGLARDCFTEWCNKWPTLAVPTDGIVHGEGYQNGERVDLEARITAGADAQTGIAGAYRADLIETRSGGSRWHTTLRSWESTDAETTPNRWIWVDVEAVGDIDIGRLAVAAPRLVRELLAKSVSARVDGDELVPSRTVMRGSADGELLAELLSRPDRTLPIVVVNDCPSARAKAQEFNLDFGAIVSGVRSRTAGMAALYTVDNQAADGLIEALGRPYGVWDGAFRVYLNDVDPAEQGNSWRHRYFTSARYARSKSVAGIGITKLLGPISAVRRPPDSYPAMKRLLEGVDSRGDFNELLRLADDQLNDSDSKISELREQVKQQDALIDELSDEWTSSLEQYARAVDEIETLRTHVRSLQSQLKSADEFYSNVSEEPVPAVVVGLVEAAEMARTHLADRLIIPDSALRELDELDTTPTATAWGQTSWEGFRALHAYAVDRADGWDGGGFWEWCQNSGNPRAWRATDKKLAMKESDSVNRSPDLRRHREFPVSADVVPSGRIYMEAHLKIAEGGGNLAPRIYFHFDDGRCLVYVGFFGPHKFLPNTKT